MVDGQRWPVSDVKGRPEMGMLFVPIWLYVTINPGASLMCSRHLSHEQPMFQKGNETISSMKRIRLQLEYILCSEPLRLSTVY